MKSKDDFGRLRQPIVTIAGHVDHGKTSILDCFRDSCVQEGEAGGITQRISFTKFPLNQIKKSCPLIEKQGVNLEIPGFLLIDTPGHAAFTNLRKRGGSLADLAILVVGVKDGIKPQTAEVIEILKNNKTPFLIALNKVDAISGWKNEGKSLRETIESQSLNVSQEFQEALLTFQGALSEHGFESELYYDVQDFTKKIAIVPCSAKTRQGISELLLVLCGLSQGFLKDSLKISETARGVALEVKKEKGMEFVEAILYDGALREGKEIAIAGFDDAIVSKVRAIQEVEPLCLKYKSTKKAIAATGVRLQLTNKEGILPGMPFQEIKENFEEIKKQFDKEISKAIDLDREGVIVKADSLGSLEALITLLKQTNVKIVKAGIGEIGKTDIISAKANLEMNPLNAAVIGFNVGVKEDVETGKVKVFSGDVVYKLIEDLEEWRKVKQEEIEREKILSLSPIFKAEVLHNYVFRNSNPAIFGVKILSGRLKKGTEVFDENGEKIARVKAIQLEKESLDEAREGQEVAVSLPGTNFERKLKDSNFIYSELGEKQFRNLKENKSLLSQSELKTLQEIAEIKRRKKDDWGI